jgi:hypothetical protein
VKQSLQAAGLLVFILVVITVGLVLDGEPGHVVATTIFAGLISGLAMYGLAVVQAEERG